MKRGGEKSSNFGLKNPPMKIESSSSSKKNKKPNLRNPLADINSSSSTSASTVSIEASSRGCLGFFLSNPSKPQLKNPKSVPNSTPRLKNQPQNQEKPVINKGVRGNLNQKLGCTNVKSSSLKSQSVLKKKKKLESEAMGVDKGEIFEQNLFNFSKLGLDETVNVTPLNKFQSGSVLDMEIEENSARKTLEKTPETITPPIQASVSPELQYGASSMVGGSTTGSCYAAGHVLSGVPDKRKCRPRGILTVGEELGFESFQLSSDENVSNSGKGRRVSLVPMPSGASMWWLLSPCKEEEDKMDNCSPNGSAEFRRRMGPTPFQSLSSPSSDVCLKSNGSSKTSSVVKMDSSISPIELSKFEGFSDVSPSIFQVRPDVEHHLVSCFSPSSFADTTTATPCKRVEESSPFSVDSLDSHNAICTPESDSSSERQRGFSWMQNVVDHRESPFEFDPLADVFRTKSLSPRGRRTSWDPADVLPLPGLNFKLHDTMMDPISGVSSSSLRDSVDSQMRVSWREGLVSRIFDMNELDSCRWLSDDEEEVGLCGSKQLSSADFDCEVDMSLESLDGELVNITKSPEFVSEEPEIIGKSKLNSPQKLRSCAESMNTDGGGLIASGDSDWTQCYKNRLFQG
ncbi:hypothetical protein MKW98_011970 [Papaver atlanticum]|uniref:Uncharacterized protein n=1 Tax=Papaver atlanticum TaxID=357466 RepID=A0AAD4X5T5_9MAGN|nr:hypothetical protein MKW98_011970 [Papaver atlanticum]